MSYIIFIFKLNQEKTMKLIKKINILTIISIIGMHAVFAHAHTKEKIDENSIQDSKSKISQEETQIIDRLMGTIDHILDSSNTISEKKSKIIEKIKSEGISSLRANAKRKVVNIMTYISKALEHEMFNEVVDYVTSMITYYLGTEYPPEPTDVFH